MNPAHHDDTWKLCFELPGSRDAKYLIFESPDVADVDHRILGLQMLEHRPLSNGLDCSATSAAIDHVVAENGIRVGMKRDSFESLMGVPSRRGDVDDYEYHEVIDTSPSDSSHKLGGYEIIASCLVKFANDSSSEIRVWYAKMM